MTKTSQALREGVTKEMIGKIHETYGTDIIFSLSLLKRSGIILEPKMRYPDKSIQRLVQLSLPENQSDHSFKNDKEMQDNQALELKKITPKGRLMERARTDSLSDDSCAAQQN
eukprot:CAMPEP_0113563374 /NCGR_PEP_ID=MMETSP0015_2-20120614/21040_1 /TAXON_ID=2838 /ORGANISM="Odontella" /LENGTH=112 /DNA_ID=CAMNT_0000465361 /DNA_START=566 /DNA_END=904 /DNA_ORIENTATION=+ /assembly_acc=CAM_ASM_000160